jgi:alanyl-tRNA synthetase
VVLTSGANALVSVSPGLVERGIQADQLQAALSSEFGGGGGGRATLARAGGGDPKKATAAFDRVRTAIAGG